MKIGDKMIKKIYSYLVEFIQEEYKFIIFLIFLYILFQVPVNYYIITGGGTSDVSSRIEVEEKHKSKGSFNLSYVTELKGTIITYALSYVIPTWEREDANLYKYDKEESIKDIEFRSDLDLLTANGNATYWAYSLAKKKVEEKSSKIYIIMTDKKYETPLKVGDEIVSVDNNSYSSVEEYRDYFQTKTEKDKVKVKIIRNKKEKEVEAPLYKVEDRIILGVGLQYVREYKTNPKINIKFRSSESGPSGGLITTLEIYNQLTKKDITHSKKIAGTGTIEFDGTIGEIGGVEHKLLGAASDHADIFLVPSGQNYKDALKYKKDKKLKIKLIEVKTIQDALEKLDDI